MKNCRIHNDIPFEWTILRDGEAEDLSVMAVEVRLEHADGGGARIEYAIEGNVVRGCFRGRHQKKNGPYTIKLTENKGANGMHTVDVSDFICLVPRSHMEGGDDSEGIVTSPIRLTSDIAFPADGAGIRSITSTSSDADEGVNTVTILLDTGGTYSFNVKNGSKGEQGDRGATPVITTSRKDGVVTIFADGEAVGTVHDGLDAADGIGDLTDLKTASKTDVVSAINELYGKIETLLAQA